jgi:hypothetical protein
VPPRPSRRRRGRRPRRRARRAAGERGLPRECARAFADRDTGPRAACGK